MTEPYRIEIRFHRGKLLLFLLGAFCFIAIGLWILMYPPEVSNFVFNDPVFKQIIGGFSCVFGLLGAYVLVRRLLGNSPALVIEDSGITDNTTAVSLGKIPWDDITDIQVRSVRVSLLSKQNFISVSVRNPDDYINAQKSVIKRRTLAMNRSQYNSLINIPTNLLSMTQDEVKKLLDQKFTEYKLAKL